MHPNKIKRSSFLLIFMLFFGRVYSQTDSVLVTGRIYDAITGIPLVGMQISLPGITSSSTNDSGYFSMHAPGKNTTLFISGKGYQHKQILLKDTSRLEINLFEESFNSVYNPVLLPYSSQPSNTTVYSVGMVEGSFSNPSVSSENLMKDHFPGLNIVTRSGSPGIGSNIFLRGYSSLYASNQPLVIVDGMIYDINENAGSLLLGNAYNAFIHLDIKDIESISLIKDGNSLFGSKAANGVIVIKTLQAKEIKTNIDFYTHFGVNATPKNIPVMDANDYRIYLTDQLSGKGMTPDEIQQLPYMNDDINSTGYYRYHNTTNWQNEIFRQGYEQNYYLRVAGGDQIAKYGLSIGYLNNDGIVKGTDMTRYSMRFNADVSITSRFRTAISLAYTDAEKNLFDDGISLRTGPVYLGLVKSPLFSPYLVNNLGQTTPTLETYDLLSISNPVAILENMTGNVSNKRFFGSARVSYDISDKTIFSTLIGINYDKNNENIFIPQLGVIPDTLSVDIAYNSPKSNVSRYFGFYNDTHLEYANTFNYIHNLSASLGIRYQANQTESDWGIAYNTPSDDIKDLGSGSDQLRRTGGMLGAWKWMSFYSSVAYDFNNKYFLSANVAMDGSSRFGSKAGGVKFLSRQFGLFPSIGAGWLISSEDFMNSYSFIDLLKIRLSYGITGNDDIGNYGDNKYYTSQRFIGVVGTIRGNIPNPYIQWETNKKMNAGLDIAIMNERIRICADFFSNQTKDMLVLTPASIISGFDYIVTNDGSMNSNGYEFSVDARIISKKIVWDAGFGIAHYKNEIKELPVDQVAAFGRANIITGKGMPAGMFYGFKTEGVFATSAEAAASGLTNKMSTGELVPFRGGDVVFHDLDENLYIDYQDMQVIGDPNPDYTGMFNSRLAWKGLSLDVLFTFSYGNDVYNHLRHNLETMSGVENQTIAVQNRWKSEGQITDIPKAEWGDPMGNSRFSDRWIEDGSYLRVKNITLSYILPIKNDIVQNARVFLSANNVYTFTKYLGYDPEFSHHAGILSQGIDFGLTPQFRSVYFGIKIGL